MEIKRKDRRLRDMEAQMKELQDSLNKAKWEAEQGVAEGGVKEMAEEEMEVSMHIVAIFQNPNYNVQYFECSKYI